MPLPPDSLSALQSQFAADLPRLERVARFRLRRIRGEALDEAVAETLALCWDAYVRLFGRGESLPVIERFAQKTAEFAAKRVLSGRPLAGQRSRDALSRLHRSEELAEAVCSDSPAELAAVRVDFETWLATLRPNQREVITALASGKNTVDVGAERGVTYGAVSNMRRMLRRQWEERFGSDQ